MYDAPKARIEEVLPERGSILRGFLGGMGALLFGVVLAVGWLLLAMMLYAGNTLAGNDLAGWSLAVPLLPWAWTAIHHHRRGHRDSVSGVLVALGAWLLPLALLVAYALLQ